MNKLQIVIAFLLIGNFGFAQKKTKEEVLNIIAEETCECVSKDETVADKNASRSEKEVALGLCMFKSYSKHKDEAKGLEKMVGNPEALGEEVGMRMLSYCSDTLLELFSDEIVESIEEDRALEADIPPPPPASKSGDYMQLTGKLVKYSNDAVSYVIVKDEFGKEHTFIILYQFNDENVLSKKKINKEVVVYYQNEKIYDISEKGYRDKKVLMYIE